jgi:hypothetical protein
MRRNRHRFLSLGISIFAVLTLSPALVGQASPDSEAAFGLPTDWSHHHVIFSKPGSAEQARRVQRDPRYWQQLSRRSSALVVTEKNDPASGLQPDSNASRPAKNGHLNGDWSQDIGSGATVGATDFPAKYSFNLKQANCGSAPQPDFAVYTTGIFGSSQASIVAYDNLYSGCGGTVPTVYWAYSTGAKTLTSPVFSRDGTQIAFVQSNSLSHGVLVLLKWAASTTETVTSPATPTHVSPAAYLTCTAPCLTTAGLPGLPGVFNNDTNSSVFYDYSNDTAYVGDDAGWLHKFTPVFNGILTDVTTGGWPVQVNPGSPTALTSPVHDYASGNVFVADTGGFLYLVNSTPAVTQSGQLDFSSAEGGAGIVQGPIVDSTSGLVYVFASSDGSSGCIGGTDCTAVYQLTTSFASGAIGSEAVVGASTLSGSAPSPLYVGAFDSTYENSVNATGHLYVCGNTGGPPVLYQIAIGAGVLGTVTPGPVLADSSTPCSPVTDVMNPNASGGATEWVFASVETGGVASGCSLGGCIFNFKDTPWKPSTAYLVGQEVLDSNLHVEVVSVAGTSGATVPFWTTSLGGTTTDGPVQWLNQGSVSAFTPPAWTAGHHYPKNTEILDPAGNIELVTSTGTDISGGTIPSFSATAGGTTNDGTVTWTNVGAIATAAMPAAGGTSGIVIDNTVDSGTERGASQIYFSTLNGGCGTGGADGCAVQASQAALQ